MTPQDIITRFREQVADEDPPYLWGDEEALVFLVDAQDMFCRLTGGIADMTVPSGQQGSPATRLVDLAVTQGQPYTAHSPYILRIRSVWLRTLAMEVPTVSEGDIPRLVVNDYGTRLNWGRGLSLDDNDIGDVRWAVLGIIRNQIRWLRVPNAADTARLHVYRLPYPRITGEKDTLEIDEQHHLHLVKWMKHLAYSKEDSETYDKQLADKNEKLFRDYCAEARGEIDRQRHKTRVVQMNAMYSR